MVRGEDDDGVVHPPPRLQRIEDRANLRVDHLDVGLVVGERRGRLTPDAVKAFLKAVEDLGIELDTSKPSDRVLDLARRHGLSVYDALYLELTLRRGFPLATLDRALGHAARAEGATLLA